MVQGLYLWTNKSMLALRPINKKKYIASAPRYYSGFYNDVERIITEKMSLVDYRLFPEQTLRDDIGADSLDQVELIMAFEDQFDIEITDQEAEKLGANVAILTLVNFLYNKCIQKTNMKEKK